jgi:hypothetical protein
MVLFLHHVGDLYTMPRFRLQHCAPRFATLCLLTLVIAACSPAAPTTAPRATTAPATTAPEQEATSEAADATEQAAEQTEATTDAGEAGTDEATQAAADEDSTAEATSATGSAPSGEGVAALVSVGPSRLRSAPSISGDVVAQLAQDTEITILGQTADAGYVYVRTADGTEGWIAKQNVTMQDLNVTIPVMTPAP